MGRADHQSAYLVPPEAGGRNFKFEISEPEVLQSGFAQQTELRRLIRSGSFSEPRDLGSYRIKVVGEASKAATGRRSPRRAVRG